MSHVTLICHMSIFVFKKFDWWSLSVEGLLSKGPTPSSMKPYWWHATPRASKSWDSEVARLRNFFLKRIWGVFFYFLTRNEKKKLIFLQQFDKNSSTFYVFLWHFRPFLYAKLQFENLASQKNSLIEGLATPGTFFLMLFLCFFSL